MRDQLMALEQGTDEWLQARCGKVTASRITDLMAKTKSGWGAGRANYMAQLIAERLTGSVADSFSNAAMQWGTDTEPQARAAYEFQTDATVDTVGLVLHQDIPDAAASPDGLVGDDGLIEIKCPNTATHIDTILADKVPTKYIPQMQFQMACTGRQWCDFISFDPRMPPHLQMWVWRVPRDDKHISEIEEAVSAFLTELTGKVDALSETQAAAE